MKRFVFVLLTLFLAACETVPITGRQQLSLLSDAEINALAASEYEEFVRESTVVTRGPEARLVEKVGRRIQAAVDSFFESRNEGARLENYEWEFVLVDDDEINAFCLPGGKVAINTGILPVAESEAGLAVVMGHEVAHAVANHGSERLSQHLVVDLVGAALGAALEDEDDPMVGAAFNVAFGIGTHLGVLLPYSRLHESEADKLGLIFMAMAGYDPQEAPRFWRRMADATGGGDGGLEFLSTHPSDETRIRDLQAALPEAQSHFAAGTDGSARPFVPPAADSGAGVVVKTAGKVHAPERKVVRAFKVSASHAETEDDHEDGKAVDATETYDAGEDEPGRIVRRIKR